MDLDSIDLPQGELEEGAKPKRTRRYHRVRDSKPLTREEIQFDFLNAIFANEDAVFSDPFQDGKKVNFRDLYVSGLLHAKMARSVRDRMLDSDLFSTDYAMLSLLANVGRISSSMAFYAEARTSNRTYHPVPALQRTEGGLTDGQRVRNALKSLMATDSGVSEGLDMPSGILAKKAAGHVPSTNVFQLLFALNNHSSAVGTSHFRPAESEIEFSDLFRPIPVPSAERARAFLWLCYHYLEPSSPGEANPFDDPAEDKAGRNPELAPLLRKRTPAELAAYPAENVDPPEETAWAEKMGDHRRAFLDNDKDAVTAFGDGQALEMLSLEPTQPSSPPPTSTSILTIMPPGVAEKRRSSEKNAKIDDSDLGDDENRPEKRRRSIRVTKSQGTDSIGRLILTVPPQTSRRRQDPNLKLPELELMPAPPPTEQMISFEPAGVINPVSAPVASGSGRGRGRGRGGGRGRRGGRGSRKENAPVESHVPAPQPQPGVAVATVPQFRHRPLETYRPASPEQTMLQYTWYKITATDPLLDSDDEGPGDHHTYLDYSRRLQTLYRLTGKSSASTPSSEPGVEAYREEVYQVPIQANGRRTKPTKPIGTNNVQQVSEVPIHFDNEW